ncbi:MAG: YggT family protein [Pseudomonadota bacterium]
MLTQLALLILEAVTGFFVILLLVRFYMQWLRVSFHNQIGQFVVAVTDWLVRPARRVIPGLMGLDLSSFVLALGVHSLSLAIAFWLKGYAFGGGPLLAVIGLLAIGFLELIRYSAYILIGVVIIAAVLSWVNPYSPVAPLFNALARPFLRPLQRLIPPIANVDLSPIVLLLVLQIALLLLAWVRTGLLPLLM